MISKEQEYLNKYKPYELGYNVLEFSNGKDYLNRNNNTNNKDNKDRLSFIKVYHEELNLLLPVLNSNERVFILSVIPYVNYNTNLLLNSNGSLKIIDLIEITNLNRSELYKVIKSLIDKKIIYKTDKKRYYINPWLMSSGNGIDITLVYMFQEYYINVYGVTFLEYYCWFRDIEYNEHLRLILDDVDSRL